MVSLNCEILKGTDSELLDKVLEIIDSANAEGHTVISIFTRSEHKRDLIRDWFGKLNFDVCDISDVIFELRW